MLQTYSYMGMLCKLNPPNPGISISESKDYRVDID